MTSQSSAPSRVVVLAAIDDTDVSNDVLRTSAGLAQALPGAELHLVHVVEPLPNGDEYASTLNELVRLATALLDAKATESRELFVGPVATHLAAGTPVEQILRVAAELRADLVVVGSHRKTTAQRWLLGSVSEQVLRKASCAVLLARPKDYSAVTGPDIEPPCADCLTIQKENRTAAVWCARHDRTRRHPKGHVHYESPQPFAVGSILIRPEGRP